MGIHADDLRETEEMWAEMWREHENGTCGSDCPWCNPEFVPLFTFQYPRKKLNKEK